MAVTNYGGIGGRATPQFGLAGQTNSFMSGQAALPYRMNLPGYGANLQQATQNTGNLLRGQVPLDVLQQIQTAGAERGVATGSAGSPNANAAWLRALGLTSLGLQQQGQQNFSQQIADTPVPEIWNPMSLYVPQVLAQQELDAAIAGTGENKKKEYSMSTIGPGGTRNYQYRYFM